VSRFLHACSSKNEPKGAETDPYSAPGFGSTKAYEEHIMGAVETLLDEGKDGKPKMMTIGTLFGYCPAERLADM
jgi:hypothetical protein